MTRKHVPSVQDRNKMSLKERREAFAYNIDAETGIIEKKPTLDELTDGLRSRVGKDDDFSFDENDEAEKLADIVYDNIPTPEQHIKQGLEESTEFPKGKQSIAIEHIVAELGSAGLRWFTGYLFKPYKAMTEVESKSSVVPSVRMLQRRIDKFLKVNLPISKMDKADKADIEEMITAVGNYLIRVVAMTFNEILNKAKHKEPRNVVPNQPTPYTQHELNIIRQRQQAYQAQMKQQGELGHGTIMANSNGDLTVEQKEALLRMVGTDTGTVL